MFDQIEASQGARLLDVGCGPAMIWVENRDRMPRNWSLTLIDLSPGMIEAARDRLADDDRFEFAVADAQELPFEDDSFDLATASHMLYHVPDRRRALTELRRVVRDGGSLYVSTVGIDHMRELHGLVGGWGEAHVTFLLEDGAAELAEVFDDVKLRRYDDSLEVTELEPLLAVVLSGVAGDLLDADEIDEIRARIEETIAREGVFRVTKSTGVFVCN